MKLTDRQSIFILLSVCILIFLPHLGMLPVNIMEARNFVTAREMLHDNHWLLTTFNGEARYEKPPLPTWMTAVSGAIFGLQNTAAMRLPAVLMAFILAFTTFQISKKLTSHTGYALISTLIMITSFYILWAGRNGQWDIFTHAFMMVAIYQIYLFFNDREHLYIHALLAGMFMGWSFMSKGPVSLYALLLPFLIAFGWVYKFGKKAEFSSRELILPTILFFLVSIVVSGWWFVYIYQYDQQTAQAITSEEVNNWNNYNVRPFYYYWNFFIQSGTWTIIALVSLLYPYLKNKVLNKKAYTFTLIWTLSTVVLLSMIPEKKPRYLLPVLIPLAMNMGFYVEYLFRSSSLKMKTVEKIPVWAHFGLIGIVGIAVPFLGYWYLQDQLKGNWLWFILLSFSLFVIGVCIFLALRKWDIIRAFFLTITFMCALVIFGLPLSHSITNNSQYKDLAELQEWVSKSGVKVYEFKEATPELIWAYGAPIPVLTTLNSVSIPTEEKFGVLAFEEMENEIHLTFLDYHIEKVGFYDMNPRGKDQGGHKARLYRDLYMISKK